MRSLELGKYVKRTGKKTAFNASYEFEESASSNQSSSSGSVSASQSPILLERLIQQEIVKNSNFIVDHLVATLLTFGGNSKENSTVLGFKANPAMVFRIYCFFIKPTTFSVGIVNRILGKCRIMYHALSSNFAFPTVTK